MNDLVRPSLYGSHHQILPVKQEPREEIKADVVGPICESSDFLAKDRKIPKPKPGELLAVMSAGAYGFPCQRITTQGPDWQKSLFGTTRFTSSAEEKAMRTLSGGKKSPSSWFNHEKKGSRRAHRVHGAKEEEFLSLSSLRAP